MGRALRLEDGLYFVDLPSLVVGRFEPAAGVGAGWVPFEYELEDFAGVGLATGAHSSAGELVLDLGLSGWHTLHFCHTPLLDVWLDGEQGYRALLGPQESDGIQDFPLRAADLTGHRLHIAPRRGVNPREVVLFYVRAVACEGAPKGARNLVATNDGHDIFLEGLEAARDIYRFFYLFRDSDFFRMLWGNYGGGLVRPEPGTDLADVIPWGATHDFYAYERLFAESLRKIHHGGEDALATAVAAAREVGMEIHFYFRVGAFYLPFPHHGKTSRFYLDHPELRCRDEFGREVKRISYAFPEVQESVLRYFEWLLHYEPDGLCLAFNRGLPMMVFEEPVLDEFRRRHGCPPRLPEEADGEPMRLVRQELLAGFVGRVNRLVSERGKVLSCICPRNFDENRRRGLDLEMLVERGLVESVMVGAGHEDTPGFTARNNLPPVDFDDLEPLVRLKRLGPAKVYAGRMAGWPKGDIKEGARWMLRALRSGLDGGFFWDTQGHFDPIWDRMRRFGSIEYLEDLLAGRLPPVRRRDTLRIHDLTVDRYNPWNAY